MIEDALFLALGFCVAVVLALACLPLLWGRALRLTKQRLELLVPWSEAEIDAERDGLRAQAAVERRRLEQDVERSQAAAAARHIAVGERTVDLVKVELARDALRDERTGLIAELAAQAREAREADGQRFAAEKALHDADRRIETDAASAREQAARYDRLAGVAEARRGTIAALETRVASLVAQIEDRDDMLLRRDAALAQVTLDRTSLASDNETLGTRIAALQQAHDTLQRELADEREQAAERKRRLAARTRALAVAEAHISEQDHAMKHKDALLQALQDRFDRLTADLAALRDTVGFEAGSAYRDKRLREEVVAVGDDALALLKPEMGKTETALPLPTDAS